MTSHRVSKQIEAIDHTIGVLKRLKKELIAQDEGKESIL